ncbi:MAG: hypothetical protein J6R85_01470, partial [Lentisphaeria bacterium]|nr:hypothetical protein [Lentisphaeria bacterium]
QPGARHLGGGVELIREIDREVTRLFNAPPGTGHCRVLIFADMPGDTVNVRHKNGMQEIVLGETFPEQKGNGAFESALAARLLAARFRIAGGGKGFPPWAAAGFAAVLHANRTSGIIARNIRHFPYLRLLLERGAMPDFRRIMTLPEARFKGASADAMAEFGRFLLEAFGNVSSISENALGDYMAGILAGGRPEEELFQTHLVPPLSKHSEWKITLNQLAERAAFNARTPRPAAFARKTLAELLVFPVPIYGKDGVATGETYEGNFEILPRLRVQRHPDGAKLQLQTARKLSEFARSLDEESANAVVQLQFAIQHLKGDSPDAERAGLIAARARVEQALERRWKIELLLEKAEAELVPGAVRLAPELRELDAETEFLSRRGLEFLQQNEQKYLEQK